MGKLRKAIMPLIIVCATLFYSQSNTLAPTKDAEKDITEKKFRAPFLPK